MADVAADEKALAHALGLLRLFQNLFILPIVHNIARTKTSLEEATPNSPEHASLERRLESLQAAHEHYLNALRLFNEVKPKQSPEDNAEVMAEALKGVHDYISWTTPDMVQKILNALPPIG